MCGLVSPAPISPEMGVSSARRTPRHDIGWPNHRSKVPTRREHPHRTAKDFERVFKKVTAKPEKKK
jgi:hypothetical protein